MKFKKDGTIIADHSSHTGSEPTWLDAKKLTVEEYKKRAGEAMGFYNYYCNSKDCVKFIIKWMKENDYSHNQIEVVEKYSGRFLVSTTGRLARCFSMGMPTKVKGFDEYHRMLIRDIAKCLYGARKYCITNDPAPKPKGKKKSPLEKMRENVIEKVLAPLDAKLDLWVSRGEKIATPDLYSMLNHAGIPPKGCKQIKKYLKAHLKEFNGVKAGKDAQLVEGYNYLKKREVNALVTVYTKMLAACEKYELDKRPVRKKRIRATVSATKQIARLQYRKKSDEYNYSSIDPTEIVGAKTVYLFNEKYRSLTKLVASDRAGLSVKGTTIYGFNEKESFKKGIRKPQKLLNVFKQRPGPAVLERTVEELKTKKYGAKGRCNHDTLILYKI